MTKHTEGPWLLTGGATTYYALSGDWNGVPGPTMFEVHPTKYLIQGVIEANARLIAAAPDLLEALKALVEHGTDSPQHLAAEGAIAKAEGRLP